MTDKDLIAQIGYSRYLDLLYWTDKRNQLKYGRDRSLQGIAEALAWEVLYD